MSLARRRLYFYSFCLVFFVVIPILIFYANGYRLTKDWKVAGTGGIYVYASESGADVSLDGVKMRQSGIFQRGILLDGLKEGAHSIVVSKEGYSVWKKTFEVKDGFVSQGYPFLVRTSPEVVSLEEFIATSATSTRVRNTEYSDALLLFQKSSVKKNLTASSSPYGDNALQNGNLVVFEKARTVSTLWLGDTNSMPYFFCNAVLCDASTSATSTVFTGASLKSHLEFLPGRNDVILLQTLEGIEAVELDTKSPQNEVLLYPTKADFRVSGSTLYLKEGTKISTIDL